MLKEENGFRAPGSFQVTKSGSDKLVLRIGLSERSPSNVLFAFFCVDGGDLAGGTSASAAAPMLRIRTRTKATGVPSAPAAAPTLRVKNRTESKPAAAPRLVMPKRKDET